MKNKIAKYGFIYPVFQFLVSFFYYTNIIEWLKKIVLFFIKGKERKKAYSRLIVDIFIVVKWLFVLYLIFTETFSQILFFVVCYLIFTNIFTYFYYHIWEQKQSRTADINKRGFLHLMLAFIYSNLCFAYTYLVLDNYHFGLKIDSYSEILSSILFSSANSLTLGYDKVILHSNIGYILTIIQVFVSFVFVSLVIANSIPKNTYTK